MLGFRRIGKSADKGANDTGKELQKLTRQDLLALLLDQTREVDRLRDEVTHVQGEKDELDAFVERLKTRLDDKDAQLEHLKTRLDDKDVALQQLFQITRQMASANNQAERMALLLKVDDALANRYVHHMETADQPVAIRESREVVAPEPVVLAPEPVEHNEEPTIDLLETDEENEDELVSEFTEDNDELIVEVVENEEESNDEVASAVEDESDAESDDHEEVTIHNLKNEELDARVPLVEEAADDQANEDVETPEASVPVPHVDYLYADPEPIAHAGEVR